MIVDYDADLFESEYKRGLNEAWELVRRLRATNHADLVEIFDKDTTFSVIEELSASEAMDKWKAWKDKNEIRVGDEIKIDGDKGVVIALQPRTYVLSEDGTGFLWLSDNDGLADNKTGRHFNAIEKVLNQMKEKE